MSEPDVVLECRRPRGPSDSLFLVGPGGAGKSTLGRLLGNHLGWPVIDLDFIFCERVAIIGQFIADNGYERYRAENLALAESLVRATPGPFVFVTSSGFLAAPARSEDATRALAVLRTGHTLSLLPSADIDTATAIIVARQLSRPFGLDPHTETQKVRERFPVYRHAGDATIISTAPAESIARYLLDRLKLKSCDQHG